MEKSKRTAVLIFGLICLLGVLFRSQGQTTYLQWGVAGSSSTNGVLDASLIPSSTGANPVRYSNVNGLGYDVVVVTSGLAESAEAEMPWNNLPEWWYEGAAPSKSGQSIPYSTVEVHFYQQGTTVPFGVTGVNFTFQNAKVGERYRNFSYWDTAGNEVGLSFTNYDVFSYSSGAPTIHSSDNSVDSGIPYTPGNTEGDYIGVNMSPIAISGFTFQTGRVNSSYGSNFLTALGFLLPTGQIIIQTGSDYNITAGPCYVSTGSNAALTPTDLLNRLNNSAAAVTTGSGIFQNIEVYEDIVSDSGNSLTIVASQNILSATSQLNLTAISGSAGSLSLSATGSVLTSHIEAVGINGTSGSITINAGDNIEITNGMDSSASFPGAQGGDIVMNAGNTLTVDTINSGGGGNDIYTDGAPGNICLTASNSINVEAIYDDSGPGFNPEAVLSAPLISIGQSAASPPDITGTLYLTYPASATGSTITLGGTMIGTGAVAINAGTGTASLLTEADYSGETDVLSGVLSMLGNSIPSSDLVLENSSALLPGTAVSGSSAEVASLCVGTNATVNIVLTDTPAYDNIQDDGEADFDGLLNVQHPSDFAPAIGQIFDVIDYADNVGTFGTNQGLRLADRVLEPFYTDSSLLLVTLAIPSGASQPLQPVPAPGLFVPAGGYYDGLTTGLQTADGFTASGTLVDGTASEDATVTMSLAASGTTNFTLQGSIGGFLLNVLGTGGDKYVVQLDYKEAGVLAAAGDKRQIYLASTDGTSPFQNAVMANTDLPDEMNNPTEIIGPFDPTADYQLGYYGVDTVDDRVWAVVDYDGFFGVGALDLPASPTGPAAATEPASGVLALSATLNGMVNYNGYCSTVVFESGTDPCLANANVSDAVISGSDSGFVQVCYPATCLTAGTTYYFRIDAVSTSGTQYGGILSFVTPQTAVNDWRYSYFGTYTNAGNAADTADPTGDGIPNLLKYATGMSPLVGSTTPAAVTGEASSGGMTYLTLTFNEIADPALTYSVQASGSPAGPWTTIWSSTGASNNAGSVTVQDTVPIGGEPSRFLRLKVYY